MRKTLIAILMALALVVIPVGSALAAISDTVTVNATPAFISISVTEASWTINGGPAGDSKIRKNTEYYATVANTTTPPTNPVVDNDCLFNLVNSSTVATNITLTCSDFSPGDLWTNAESKTNGPNSFAMLSYFKDDGWVNFATSGVIVKKSGSDVGKSSLGATTNIKFGIGFKSPTGDATSATAQSGILTVSAAAP